MTTPKHYVDGNPFKHNVQLLTAIAQRAPVVSRRREACRTVAGYTVHMSADEPYSVV